MPDPNDILGQISDQNMQAVQPPPQQPKQAPQVPRMGRPILMNLIQGMINPQSQAQPGQRPPSRLNVFEDFLGNFVYAMGQGMANAGSGPGANVRGAGAAMTAPYQRDVQQFQLQQQAKLQQAQTDEAQAKAEQTRNMGQMVNTPYGPMSSSLAEKIFAAQIGAGAKTDVAKIGAGAKIGVEQMKLMASVGQVARVVPATDAQGNKVMRAYNKFGQPIGELDGAIPPSSYLGKTTFKQEMDGSWSKTETTPNIPAGKKPPTSSGATPSGFPKATAAGLGKTPLDNTAKQLVDGDLDPSQLSKRGPTLNVIYDKANKYSQATYGKPFDVAQAATDYKYARDTNTQNTLKLLDSLTGRGGRKGDFDTLTDLQKKVTRGQFPALNDKAAWLKFEAGNADEAAFKSAMVEVSDKLAKIFQGGGGTSDAKMQQAQEIVNKSLNNEQFGSTMSTLKELLNNRKTSLIGDNRYLQRQFSSGGSSGLIRFQAQGKVYNIPAAQKGDFLKDNPAAVELK